MFQRLSLYAGLLLIVLCSQTVNGEDVHESEVGEVLHPNKPVDIYVCAGRSTTVVIRGNELISAIALSSSIISYKYNKVLNQLEITPTGRLSGLETNLNLRIGSEVYVLIVKLVSDVRTQYVRIFTPESQVLVSDEDSLFKVAPRKPSYVDLLGSIKRIERMEHDLTYKKTQVRVHEISLNDTYVWNRSLITLEKFYQFLDEDLLIFRARWTNRTGNVIYLDPRDLGIWIDEINIPIIAATRKKMTKEILPGETDVIYLGVQGYRLSRKNNFKLKVLDVTS
jgi:hypothetical protein